MWNICCSACQGAGSASGPLLRTKDHVIWYCVEGDRTQRKMSAVSPLVYLLSSALCESASEPALNPKVKNSSSSEASPRHAKIDVCGTIRELWCQASSRQWQLILSSVAWNEVGLIWCLNKLSHRTEIPVLHRAHLLSFIQESLGLWDPLY